MEGVETICQKRAHGSREAEEQQMLLTVRHRKRICEECSSQSKRSRRYSVYSSVNEIAEAGHHTFVDNNRKKYNERQVGGTRVGCGDT